MKIQTTEAQVWWIALPDEIRPARGIDGPRLFAGIQSTFNFATPPQIKEGTAEFQNGRLASDGQDILITRLSVFNDGLNIQVPTTTDDAEKILRAALSFFFEMGVRRPTTEVLEFFQSQIIADFECALENILPKSLLKKISAAMPIDGQSCLLNIATNFDATVIADPRWRGVNPSIFRIDRRASMPYALNRYFCLANMTSSEHIDILSEFERFALSARR
ncbi:hypothetical protein [Bradyrhizobium sp.]|uniref:hypothetical protein n=1 Tax=Bradyrhizobium sp. TaxID=376 RepID=UPI00403813E0